MYKSNNSLDLDRFEVSDATDSLRQMNA